MMFQLFNYTTLSTRLEKSTRTLFITLNRPERANALHQEMLFELESLLAWCTSRVEINSLYIDACTPMFSPGVPTDALKAMSAQQIEKMQQRLHKIVYAMMQLPQTVFVDLGEGSSNWASELAIGADVRLCSKSAQINFNHTHLGLVPAAGGMGFLTHLVPASFARQWVSLGTNIPLQQLLSSGFIHVSYDQSDRVSTTKAVLEAVFEQAPVQRIQAKLGQFESLRPLLEPVYQNDKKIARAALVSEDWKSRPEISSDAPDAFMPAKSMSYAVKLSLVKNDETTTTGPETTH